jgi:hypothetical protein
MAAISDLSQLLAGMEPSLREGVWVFGILPAGVPLEADGIVASIREPEGMSVVMEEGAALGAGVRPVFRAAWITLTVHSDLEAVGLTAAVSAALGAAGISCNVVAGTYHDHLFVPAQKAADAMAALRKLQAAHAPP